MGTAALLGASASGLTAATATVIYGALYHNSSLFGPVIRRLPTRERLVALTFDDGPNPQATPHILDTLAREMIPATFFMLGRHVERWPALARRAAEEGHEVGNHGYFHRKLHLRGPRYVRHDLELGTTMVEQATGRQPRFFRAPHGFRNPWVTPIAASLGQRVVGWTLGVWDSARPGTEVIARRAIEGLRPGGILLLHDGDGYDPDGDRMQTAHALPGIIDGLRQQGYQFGRLEESET